MDTRSPVSREFLEALLAENKRLRNEVVEWRARWQAERNDHECTLQKLHQMDINREATKQWP